MIPGWLVALLTFPGVVLHEWAHKLFCDWFGVPVLEVRYFQLGNGEAGYVKHGEPKSFMESFWISTGPLLINSLVAFMFGAFTAQAKEGTILQFALGWLSISAGMHAFPSNHDAAHISVASRTARADGGSVFYLLTFPFVALIRLANALRFFWLDAMYAAMLFMLGLQVVRL